MEAQAWGAHSSQNDVICLTIVLETLPASVTTPTFLDDDRMVPAQCKCQSASWTRLDARPSGISGMYRQHSRSGPTNFYSARYGREVRVDVLT